MNIKQQYLPGTITCAPITLDEGVDIAAGDDFLAIDFVAVTRQTERGGPNDNGLFIEPQGFDLSRFQKNPTLLLFHEQGNIPIGKVVQLDQSKQRIKGRALIPHFEDAFLEDVRNQIERGVLKGISIGFFPTVTEPVHGTELVEEIDDAGKKRTVKKKVLRGTRVLEGRLLEISIVAQGADEDALVTSAKAIEVQGADEDLPDSQWLMERTEPSDEGEECIRHTLRWGEAVAASLGTHAKVCNEAPETKEEDTWQRGLRIHRERDEAAAQKAQRPEDFRAIPWSRHGAVALANADTRWDGAKARASATVAELKAMSLFEDKAALDTKGAYKGPHHLPNGTLVLRGVQAAMGALLGARGGFKDISEAERRKGHAHLAKELGRFDQAAPEFRAYTNEELEDLAVHGQITIPGNVEIAVAHVPAAPESTGYEDLQIPEIRISDDLMAELRAEVEAGDMQEDPCCQSQDMAEEIATELATIGQEAATNTQAPAPQAVDNAAVEALEQILAQERRRRVALTAHVVALLTRLESSLRKLPVQIGRLLGASTEERLDAEDPNCEERNIRR
jgi:phage head maturation protease